MLIDEKDIEDYIKFMDKESGFCTTLLVRVVDSVFEQNALGVMSAVFDMKYNVINVMTDGIFVIGINSDNMLTAYCTVLKKEDILEIDLKEKRFGCRLRIQTKFGFVEYDCKKHIFRVPWQSYNYKEVLHLLS